MHDLWLCSSVADNLHVNMCSEFSTSRDQLVKVGHQDKLATLSQILGKCVHV